MKKILTSTITLLIAAVALGLILGPLLPPTAMSIVLTIKHIAGQIIFFMVPLIIIACVAPSIATLQGNASRLLLLTFAMAYASSIGAALFALALGYNVIPLLHILPATTPLRTLPTMPFQLDIPPLMSVMSALLAAVLLGLGCLRTRATLLRDVLLQLREAILALISRVLLPLLPIYVAANFCALAYEGNTGRLTIFLPVILIVIAAHWLWLLLLYTLASAYTRQNGWQVIRHYGPAYLTALGTMSSAATLGVALQCAARSSVLRPQVTQYAIPLLANIHLCGSVLTETFFVMVVSQLLYGAMPPVGSMILFIFLLGIFAVGAPGVPGGVVLSSLGIVVATLAFDDAGTAMLIAIFALQDSFGTACNVTGDGALTLILTRFTQQQSTPTSTNTNDNTASNHQDA